MFQLQCIFLMLIHRTVHASVLIDDDKKFTAVIFLSVPV